jgi:regulator of sigma E protease
MNIFSTLLNILGIGFLIFIHELGHFIFCKLFSISVSAFAIGIGPRIFSKKCGETEYSIGLIPISGYVAIGKNDNDEIKELREKNFFKSFFVIFGGVFFNILFTYASIIFICTTQLEQISNTALHKFAPSLILTNPNGEQTLLKEKTLWDRCQEKNSSIPAELLSASTITIEKETTNSIIKRIHLGFQITNNIIVANYWGLINTLKGKQLSCLSGPIGIFSEMKNALKNGFISFLVLLSFISINLALLNCVPIPIFDGGRFFFLIIEKILGREIPDSIQTGIFYFSIGIIAGLTILSTYNDIYRILSNW